ncbi:MAG: asparagine synthase (glutamine-hydrolyzing) [Candidatus Omnitrophica bacterium]|nr:asparagine synthase (glutamine-hydrolyzing) [Candidatus Omnitrophota bacterium]
MCGIAGVASSASGFDKENERMCLDILKNLRHRGPDQKGVFTDAHIALGHQRLSIIDLSESAKQPMTNEDGSIWLSYNGEIYNYRELRKTLIAQGHVFGSHTDSETILHLYEERGTDCLKDLRGMFAFAIWDQKKKQLFLARDRLGIKPLYFAEKNGRFLFASEAQALARTNPLYGQLGTQGISYFLQQGSIPPPFTIFKEIHCLEPGHYLLWKPDRPFSIHSYWNLAEILQIQDQTPFHKERLQTLFLEAITQHLTSDVPLAILLSGGMDSSALVALASRSSQAPIHTLSLGFEEAEYDESDYAKLVSRHFKTHHHECKMGAGDVVHEITPFIQAMDQPTGDGLNTFLVSRQAKAMGFKVLLSGLGGDEVFSGYAHFKRLDVVYALHKILAQTPRNLKPGIISLLKVIARFSGLSGASRLDYLMHADVTDVYRVYRGLFSFDLVQKLLGRRLEPASFSLDSKRPLAGLVSNLDRATYMEFTYYLHDQLLRDTDIMSMRHSIEVRVPYLDHVIVSEILSKNFGGRFDPAEHKRWLKEIVKPDFPESILRRPKQGFTLPIAHWMRTSCKERVASQFESGGSARLPLEASVMQSVWKQFLSGKIHWSLPWSLFILSHWFENFSNTETNVSA